MTISAIRCFVAVGDSLNFTAAANALFISQQVVSRQVANLEKELGVQLLDRTTRSVRLTPAGLLLHASWKELLRQSDAAIREATLLHEADKQKLRVGIADVGTVVELVRSGLERFMEEWPGVETEYRIHTFRRLRDMLRSDELDVIVSMSTELVNIQPLHMQKLCNLELSIILSKRHPRSGEAHLGLNDLADETFYFFSPAFSYDADANLRSIFQAENLPFENVQYFDGVRDMELALLSGRGIAISFNLFFDHCKGDLVFHPISFYMGAQGEQLVAAWRNPQNKNIRRLADCLLRSL